MTEQEPRIPSANEVSEIVFGSDITDVINIPQMFQYAKSKLEIANASGDERGAEEWERHLSLIALASPDLRSEQ